MRSSFFSRRCSALMLPILLATSGCMVGPDYRRPEAALATSWQAALPHDGKEAALQQWWQQFDDSVLLTLQAAAQQDSPSLALAAARIDEARAQAVMARSQAWPAVNGTASAIRSGARRSDIIPTQTASVGGLDASWEIDLFGGVRRAAEAADARVAGSESNWHEARISLASEVAGSYVQYRACRLLVAAHAQELTSLRETARLIDITAKAGFASPADAQLADAGAANAASNLRAQQAECDVTVKSLVFLTGMEEVAVRQLLTDKTEQLPAHLPVPENFEVVTLPVQLLSQRPDLASAERALAAASAEVGVAEADRYPRLSLLGAVSLSSVRINSVSAETTPWSFGPSLTLPIFDAGRRAANVDAAQARYEQALAQYRQAVREAVREVEQSLVRLDSAAQREADASAAAAGYRAYFNATQEHWRAGGESLLNLELARRSAILSEISLINLQHDHVQYWITLYKALGGGWDGALAIETAQQTSSAAPGDHASAINAAKQKN